MRHPPKVVRTRHICAQPSRSLTTRWLYRRAAQKVVTTGEAIRAQILRIGVPASHVVSIPTGIDPQAFAPGSQQEAKQLIERNSAEENAVQSKLVERLIQQQEAVAANPAAIRASVPEQGRLLTFTRSLQMDAFTDLHIGIRATPVAAASGWGRIGVLAGLGLLLAISLRLFRPSGV